MPKNNLDRLRYLVLLKDENVTRDLGVLQSTIPPTRDVLKGWEMHNYYSFLPLFLTLPSPFSPLLTHSVHSLSLFSSLPLSPFFSFLSLLPSFLLLQPTFFSFCCCVSFSFRFFFFYPSASPPLALSFCFLSSTHNSFGFNRFIFCLVIWCPPVTIPYLPQPRKSGYLSIFVFYFYILFLFLPERSSLQHIAVSCSCSIPVPHTLLLLSFLLCILGLEYYYCYVYYNVKDPKGWRNDGFRASWDCKSHWSFPMKSSLKRKIDKLTVDSSRELHRWATQLNVLPTPQNYFQDVLTLVEYFIK
jgi:hypothetical protein